MMYDLFFTLCCQLKFFKSYDKIFNFKNVRTGYFKKRILKLLINGKEGNYVKVID